MWSLNNGVNVLGASLNFKRKTEIKTDNYEVFNYQILENSLSDQFKKI